VPAMRFRVASRLASFGAAGGNSPGRPGSLLCHASPPRVSAGSPQLPHVPAVPAMELRVTPRFPSFSAAPGEIFRVAPRPRSLSLASRCFRRVAPASAPSGCASDGAPGCPASRILRRCRQLELRVAPPLRSSSLASRWFHRVAPASASSGCRGANLRVTPNLAALGVTAFASPGLPLDPAIAAGSMMNPWRVLNFASSACAADESSRPIRSCTSLPDPGCSFNLIPSACLAAN